jgi:hypothetical protein
MPPSAKKPTTSLSRTKPSKPSKLRPVPLADRAEESVDTVNRPYHVHGEADYYER